MTPDEEDKFKDFSTKLKTPHGILNVLKKSKSGDCIFYDAEKNLCKSYKYRPFDCRVYPLLMINFNGKIKFVFDDEVCKKTKKCFSKDIEKMKRKWLKQRLPLDWIKSYSNIS